MFVQISTAFTTFIVTDKHETKDVFLSDGLKIIPDYFDKEGRLHWFVYSHNRNNTLNDLYKVMLACKEEGNAMLPVAKQEELSKKLEIDVDSKLWVFIRQNFEAIAKFDRETMFRYRELDIPFEDPTGTEDPAKEFVKYLDTHPGMSQQDIDAAMKPLKDAITQHRDKMVRLLRCIGMDCSSVDYFEIEILA